MPSLERFGIQEYKVNKEASKTEHKQYRITDGILTVALVVIVIITATRVFVKIVLKLKIK